MYIILRYIALTEIAEIDNVRYASLQIDVKFQKTLFVKNKGNNKITELRAILQRESQNS